MTLEDLAKTLEELRRELHTIKRGVYGDEPNGVIGLIRTDQAQHERLKVLEDFKKKTMWIGGGIVALIEMFAHLPEIMAVFKKV